VPVMIVLVALTLALGLRSLWATVATLAAILLSCLLTMGAAGWLGVVLNPATPLGAIEEVLDDVDQVLVMTVNPGFGGQAFIDSALPKIARLRAAIDASGRTIDLEVDGGIDADTAPAVVAAGADVLVAGTASFRGGAAHYAANIAALRCAPLAQAA